MGAGAALFVNQSADVTLSGVTFTGNKAIGGSGGSSPTPVGGGGGLGGTGGVFAGVGPGGGGGMFGDATINTVSFSGAGGGLFGGGGGSPAGTCGAGGAGGGGYTGNGGNGLVQMDRTAPWQSPALAEAAETLARGAELAAYRWRRRRRALR